MVTADILICGGGIVGLTIARELVNQGYENIVVIDKEIDLGKHASGRNSGVLHAGIYYAPDSIRAKSCLRGNLLMKQYCRENNLPMIETGKVIVTKSEDEVSDLKVLYERALKNGAKVDLIDTKELSKIEPNAKTVNLALFSHYTAVVDPLLILTNIANELIASSKVKIVLGRQFIKLGSCNEIITNEGKIGFKTFINAAGAYSDKVAHAFGVGLNYSMIPFKGIYRKLRSEKSSLINGSIYPVPNIKNPFLGVHFTKNIRGEVYLGPTAIPAFGRENYGILSGLDSEVGAFLMHEIDLFISNPKFREVAFSEPKKYLMKYFFRDASHLVKHLDIDDIVPSDKVGIRPQLIDWDNKELVMDFIIKKQNNSIHILNAISPAFTCSLDFAKIIVDQFILNSSV